MGSLSREKESRRRHRYKRERWSQVGGGMRGTQGWGVRRERTWGQKRGSVSGAHENESSRRESCKRDSHSQLRAMRAAIRGAQGSKTPQRPERYSQEEHEDEDEERERYSQVGASKPRQRREEACRLR